MLARLDPEHQLWKAYSGNCMSPYMSWRRNYRSRLYSFQCRTCFLRGIAFWQSPIVFQQKPQKPHCHEMPFLNVDDHNFDPDSYANLETPNLFPRSLVFISWCQHGNSDIAVPNGQSAAPRLKILKHFLDYTSSTTSLVSMPRSIMSDFHPFVRRIILDTYLLVFDMAGGSFNATSLTSSSCKNVWQADTSAKSCLFIGLPTKLRLKNDGLISVATNCFLPSFQISSQVK